MKILKNDANSPSKFCLSYDTEVVFVNRHISKTGTISIGKIVENKIPCNVYTVDKTGVIYPQRVEQWHDLGKQEIFEYTLENGATIKATKDHKFMTSDGQMLPIDEIFERDLDLMNGHSYIVDSYDFKKITPDYFTCPWYSGNSCGLEIIKFDNHYFIEHQGCTEGYREYVDKKLQELEKQKKYESGLTNWMSSYQLYYYVDRDEEYSSFSWFVNNSINGYRNITYVKQQQVIDSSFTIEKSTTPKHTYLALNDSIEPSIKLYNFLHDSGKFSDKQLLSFSKYSLLRRFTNPFRDYHRRGEENITVQKEIFDYIIANPSNIGKIITNEMTEEFQQQYQEYQEDAKKYGDETIEEKRDRLNQEIIAKG